MENTSCVFQNYRKQLKVAEQNRQWSIISIWLLNQLSLKYYAETSYDFFFFYTVEIFSLDIWDYTAFFSVFNLMQ